MPLLHFRALFRLFAAVLGLAFLPFHGTAQSITFTSDSWPEEVTTDNDGCIYLDDVTGNDCIADLDGSGYIGSADLIIFLGFYELICE